MFIQNEMYFYLPKKVTSSKTNKCPQTLKGGSVSGTGLNSLMLKLHLTEWFRWYFIKSEFCNVTKMIIKLLASSRE